MDSTIGRCQTGDMWHEILLSEYGSNAQAAKAIYPEWAKKAPKEVKGATEVALSNRIGTLDRTGEQTGWWKTRPTLQALLAERLGIDERDIFGQAWSTSAGLTFPEFPGLPPLAADERPCAFPGQQTVLEHVEAGLAAKRPVRWWVQAGPGVGKSLAVRILRERRSQEVTALGVACLSDAVVEAPQVPRPLVLEVEEARPEEDPESLDALLRHPASVIVLAPFRGPPTVVDTPWGADRHSQWGRRNAAPSGAWREVLLGWVDLRLERSPHDTRLEVDRVRAWLRQHDPRGEVVSTPGDLLALCADFHGFGREGSPRRRASRWLKTVAPSMLPDEAPPTWKKRGAVPTYRAAVLADLDDATSSFGTRSLTRWAALVPADLVEGGEGRPGGTLACAHLAEGGLLREGAHGHVPYPRWVAEGVYDEALQRRLAGRSVEDWGRLAADASRAPLVDRALDRLTPARFGDLVARLASGPATSLAKVGALEAVVAAAGRRVVDPREGVRGADPQDLVNLLLAQLRLLVDHPTAAVIPVPFTRREPDEWYATGWALSLALPRPSRFRPEAPWVLPGWAKSLTLATIPRVQFPSASMKAASRSEERLSHLAVDVVARMTPHDVPEDIPRLLLPALFLSDRHWRLGLRHLGALHESWDEVQLGARGEDLPVERRGALASRIWELVGQAPGRDSGAVGERIRYLGNRHPGLLDFVVRNVPPAVAEETGRRYGTHVADGSIRYLSLLPGETRHAALKGWLQAGEARRPDPAEARTLGALLAADDLDLVLPLLAGAPLEAAMPLAESVWRSSPERALAEAEAALEARSSAAEAWFQVAPREHLPALVSLLDRSHRPAWVRAWAIRRAIDAGSVAEPVYRLASGQD